MSGFGNELFHTSTPIRTESEKNEFIPNKPKRKGGSLYGGRDHKNSNINNNNDTNFSLTLEGERDDGETPPALPSAPPPSISIPKTKAADFSFINVHSLPQRREIQIEGSVEPLHGAHSFAFKNDTTEENFECFGEGAEGPESLLDSTSENTSLHDSRDVNDLAVPDVSGLVAGLPPIRRNSWIRTSLRKSPQETGSSADSMGHRRWGSFRNTSGSKRPVAAVVASSNALANQLYRSSSFHSSGRSSAGDGEEMYSDGSLEDEVIDLSQKVHNLEEKYSELADNQTDVDDRYTRVKQENTELSTKLFMLEEQLRETELRYEDKTREEQRRFKDTFSRIEREKELQIENFEFRLGALEKDLTLAKAEGSRLKNALDRERSEKGSLSDKIVESEKEIFLLREDNRGLLEQSRRDRDALAAEAANSQQAIIDLRKEFENLRQFQMRNSHSVNRQESTDSEINNELKSRLTELEEEIRKMKQENRQLRELNEELNVQLLNHGLEEGRHLLNRNNTGVPNSLAAEFEEEAMSQEQTKAALKEQKEVNDQLRSYIDGILLNIIENYPQLLDVKNKCSSDNSISSDHFPM